MKINVLSIHYTHIFYIIFLKLYTINKNLELKEDYGS